MLKRGSCPQEQLPLLRRRLSDFGFANKALEDEFLITFREPELSTLRLPREARLRKLRRRRLHLEPPYLDDEQALVYADTFLSHYGFARPGDSLRAVARSDSKAGLGALLAWRVAASEAILVAHIGYPLSNPAWFIYDVAAPVTFGLLVLAHALSYQLAYILDRREEGHVNLGSAQFFDTTGQTLNRATNNAEASGIFGFEGHAVGELIYNGFSRVSVHVGNIIFAEFACDYLLG